MGIYWHRLFFKKQADADVAVDFIKEQALFLNNAENVDDSLDTDTGVVEVNFETDKKLSNFDQRWILSEVATDNYAFNIEKY